MTITTDCQSLITSDTRIKVSSTLDKSVGKKCLIDDNLETCWTSQQGLPQYIQLTFLAPVIPKRIAMTFQGGFVGTKCSVFVSSAPDSPQWSVLSQLYPEDVNRRQTFELPPESNTLLESGVHCLKLVFEQSSDFFGRVTLYELKVEGRHL
ncbi:galactose-binding like protein [Leucogyrophana mollusca]|uniref:Galactose-binding like protein n=1 Tax=Leucogyrophana mollusca TaxID=85980 RepID=A0ACB8BRP1_9AGAM|nr:galactose-binding like protein [Leucogyrophana mollusca]